MIKPRTDKSEDQDYLRRRRCLDYLLPKDILQNSETREEFRVKSVGPKKIFAYGLHESPNGKRELRRISLDRLSKDYDLMGRFVRYGIL